MLKLDLSEEEKKELLSLISNGRNVIKLLKKLNTVEKALDKIEEKKKNSQKINEEDIQPLLDYIQITKESDTKDILAASKKAEILRETGIGRAISHYTSHLDELVEDIKRQVRIGIVMTKVLPIDDMEWKETTIGTIQTYLNILKEKSPDKYKEVIDFIDYAHSHKEEIIKEAEELAKKETNALGLYTASPLAIMFSGKATHALGQARTIGILDPIRKNLEVKGVNILSQNISKIGVGEAKIFRYAIAAFTEKNSAGTPSQQLHLRVFLSLNDYAQITGTDINSENERKNFRKKLKKNLDNLLEKNITFSWSEDLRGKERNYGGISLISGYKIKGDAITVDFSLAFAEYLVSIPSLIQYPRSLYSVNDRNINAFAIGEALCRHYSINNNVIRGTEQIFSVSKLLEVTSFPSIETIKNNRWSWEERIKESFEKAIEHLHECGLLKDWCYSYSKGIKLTDKEAAQITSYEKFISLYIWYEINEHPEHKQRVSAIIEAKAKKAKNSKSRKLKEKKN